MIRTLSARPSRMAHLAAIATLLNRQNPIALSGVA
jgi:hypothetical protein